MEYYDWENSISKQNVNTIFGWNEANVDLNNIPNINEYKNAASNLWNEGKII